ncbi:hypothetical protein I7648_10680 [Collinsella tanakaei]|nr:hypothetical protein [Collinsella tanakaei]
MNIGQLEEAVDASLERLRSDDCSREMVANARWMLAIFASMASRPKIPGARARDARRTG